MRLEVCGGESCKGTFERSLGGGEGVGGPWAEEREWEVLGRRRGSGRSLGGEGVGGPWDEEREWGGPWEERE